MAEAVPPPEAPKPLPLVRHLALASFWFAFNALWAALIMIVFESHARSLEARGVLSLFGEPLDPARAVGITVGIGSLVAALVPPLVGVLSDRCCSRWGRRRPFVFVGALVLLAGLWLMYFAFRQGFFPGYLLASLVVQLGANIGAGAYAGIIPDTVPSSERGLAGGWMAVGVQLGTITGALGVGAFAGAGRYAEVTLVLTLIVALFVSFTLIGVPERPLKQAKPLTAREILLCYWVNPVRYPDFAWVWLSRAAVTLAVWLIYPFVQVYLRDVVQVDQLPIPAWKQEPWRAEEIMPYWMLVILIAAVPMGLFAGRLSDRIGRRIVVCVATLWMAAAALVFIVAGNVPTVEARAGALLVLGFCWGLGYGAFTSVDWALATEVLPRPEDHAKDMGVWNLSFTLPQTFGALIAGALILSRFRTVEEGVSRYEPAGFTVLFVAAAVCLVAGAIMVMRIRGVR